MASPRRTVSKKHVLYSEILAVTSTMRKNSRWASSAHFVNARDSALGSNLGLRISSPSYSPHPSARGADLMSGFQELKRLVRDMEDIDHVPLPSLLGPFFALIRSPLSTGPITSAALSALHSFFVCEIISVNALGLDSALIELSNTVSHCKFEASDSSGDEVVLLKIMTVIQDSMCGSVSRLLGDVEVCEMLETVLTTCCQMRLSETLRRFSENVMHAIVRNVFSRLHALDPGVSEEKLKANDDEPAEAEIKLTVVAVNETLEETAEKRPESRGPSTEGPEPAPSTPTVHTEYGLPAILELLRVLINVLDPNDQQHTDSTRLIALGILNSAFEESGHRISQFPSLKALVLDSGCKFLFQLARSENTAVLHLALRTISTVFDTTRQHLKLQQELFLAFTIDRLAPPVVAPRPGTVGRKTLTGASPRPGTPDAGASPAPELEKEPVAPTRATVPPARGETRDLILETLSQISRHPSFMVDLYTNYDCDVNCENLFERLIEFLTKGVYPVYSGGQESQQQNSQYLCLDLLLAFVNDMAARVEGTKQDWPSNHLPTDELALKKSQKILILTGASRFNTKPKDGLKYMEENHLIYTDPSISRARSLAMFLKGCTRLDKKLLGDYLSKPDNIELLTEFIGLYDFKGKTVADALRELLESFRLPGEAQQINRITETFASIFFASKPEEIGSEDAVYVLAYSVIMLNTDQHNPQVRKKMSFAQYKRNLGGVNNGADFAEAYLQNIYDSIRKREIVMPEEHTGQLGFEYAWKELLLRSNQSGDLMICNTNAFDVDMFKAVWKPVISAIAYAFTSFDDDYIIQRAIAGFRQCATLAGHFHLPDVFDFVVVSLSQATSLLSESLPSQVPNHPVVDVDGQSITVSSLSVKFGTNFKGQLASVVLYNIVNGNGNALREGWTQIFEMFQNLFLHSLLPTRMLQMEDFLGGVSMIPLRGSQPLAPAARHEGGLLSALSSYLMTPYGASSEALVPEASDADVENTMCTIDCITSCRLDELYGQIMNLDYDALIAAVRALDALAHERTITKLTQRDIDESQEDEPFSLPYDPASVFLLEMMVSIACQTPQYIETLWGIVFRHLRALLMSSTEYSILLIERAVVGLLRLCLILATTPSLREEIYVSFDLLAGLPSQVSTAVAEQIMAGLVLLAQNHREIIRSQTEWNIVFALIRSTTSHPEAARQSFDLIVALASDGPGQLVNADNFGGIVTLLDDFATLAGTTVESQHRQGRRNAPPTAADSPPIERGHKAVDLLFELKRFLPALISASPAGPQQAWRQLTLPILMSLSRQSTNAAREVRHVAIGQLQRILLGPNLVEEGNQAQVDEIFNRVIFPLLDELLKPQVFQRDPRGMPETRLRASALLCKTFMSYEVRENESKTDFRILWIQILDLLDRLMNIDRGDQLYEAIPESLKNVVLVMNATNILVPPSADDRRDERQKTLWTATHERIERFLPGFLVSVIPSPEPEPAPMIPQPAPHSA